MTLAWDEPAANEDGTPCRDLAGYKVYYDTDGGAPYAGTGLAQGNSPITVPLDSLRNPAQPDFSLSGLAPGRTYHLTVTAYDTSGNESGPSNVITLAGNTPPSATMTASPTQGSAPLTVHFMGTGNDADGDVVSYRWTFGDGTSATGQNPRHTYNTPGRYTATLTVWDNNGEMAEDTLSITVTEPTTEAPASNGSGVETSPQTPPTSAGSTTGQVLTFSPVADASVSASAPDRNYGSHSSLEADDSPTELAYLRFDVSGLNGIVQSARLRLHCVNPSSSGGAFYSLSNTNWDEDTLTFNNRPAIDGVPFADLGPVDEGDTVEVDVTSLIVSDGIYSFAIASENGNGVDYSSREDASSAPVLIIETVSQTTIELSPVADTSVSADVPATNFASAAALEVDGSPEKVAFLKFDVGPLSGSVDSATLRLYCVNGSDLGGTLYSLSDTGWNEDALTFNNRPPVDGSLLDELGPVNVGDTVELDVRSAIQGGGVYAFAFVSNHGNGADYSSREDENNPPLLIITTSAIAGSSAAAGSIPPDQDTDGDGISDLAERAQNMDANASDSDGDGVDDFLEWGPGDTPIDTDGDGFIDVLDLDSDGDGKADATEGLDDDDDDGAPNYIDMDDTDGPLGDQDHDGVDNSTEVTYLMNPNRPDSDGDGLSDGLEFGLFGWPLDSDGDQIIDAVDTDSDNDGKADAEEGTGDADEDGALNYVDAVDTDGPGADQDGDGLTNISETSIGLNPNLLDSDGDGIVDLVEIVASGAAADTDGDGIVDGMDRDSDGDGVPDAVEGYHDFDGDGFSDRLDSRMATLLTDDGRRMALKVAVGDGHLAETGLVPDPMADHVWDMVREVRFNGLSFEVRDVPVGGSVGLMVMMDHELPPDTQYWKLDPSLGYYEIPCTVSDSRLAVTLTDGGTGDVDGTANGIIVDPAVIAEPLSQHGRASTDSEAPGGGAGQGASRLFPRPSSFPAVLSIALVLAPIVVRKRKRLV